MISEEAVIADFASIGLLSPPAAQQLLAPAQPWKAVFVLLSVHFALPSARHVVVMHRNEPAVLVVLLSS